MFENKEQLIQFIFSYLVPNAMLIFPHKLTVTGKDPVLLQIFNGHITSCKNVQTTQEEAENITTHHLVESAPAKAITAADDTDNFVLLLHFTFTSNIKSQVYMQPTDKESLAHVIESWHIATAYQSHIKIMPNVLAAFGLSGCDTVCSYFGIGKKTVLPMKDWN